MDRELAIIKLYLTIDAALKRVTGGLRLRRCGRMPGLTDAEVLTLELWGEMQGHHDDAAIWRHAQQYWRDWFPGLAGYKAFVKQCANLATIKERIFACLHRPVGNIHITDGVPLPTCHLARAARCTTFEGEAAFGYCAAKNQHHFGFKGHIVTDLDRRIVAFTLAPSNIDERQVLDNLRGHLQGLLIADKGLLSRSLQAELRQDGIDLQTPLRDNMPDPRPKPFVQWLRKTRRRIETAIGQLTEHFAFNRCHAKTRRHLTSRLMRKILAYNFTLASG